MKNVVKLDNYYLPWELEEAIARFVDHYNNDLLRSGTALDVMRAHITAEGYAPPEAYQMLFPIPQQEVDLGLTQNPGY